MPKRDLHLPENWQAAPPEAEAAYSCLLTSVPSGGRLTWEFSPDPVVALWPVSMSTTPLPTRGGQVVYPGFRGIGPLIISGALRSRHDKFQLASFVMRHHEEAIYGGFPLHFIYPERDWDFAVYITAMPDIGLNGQEGEMTQFILQADITRDHTRLSEVPLSDFGVSEGIQWIPIEEAARIASERMPGVASPAPEGVSERAPGGRTGGGEGDDPPSGAQPSGRPAPAGPNRFRAGNYYAEARVVALPPIPGEGRYGPNAASGSPSARSGASGSVRPI